MDDDLGDLSEIMGDDYAHGYDGGDDDQGESWLHKYWKQNGLP